MALYGVYAFGRFGYNDIRSRLKACGMIVIATEMDRGSFYMRALSANGEVNCDQVVRHCSELPGLTGFGISPAN